MAYNTDSQVAARNARLLQPLRLRTPLMAHKYRVKMTKRPFDRVYDWELQRISERIKYPLPGHDEIPEWEAIAWGDERTTTEVSKAALRARYRDEALVKVEEGAIYVYLD